MAEELPDPEACFVRGVPVCPRVRREDDEAERCCAFFACDLDAELEVVPAGPCAREGEVDLGVLSWGDLEQFGDAMFFLAVEAFGEGGDFGLFGFGS